ncbi:MAG: hypothetical protein KIG74_06830 [Clostridiaceae bacterium]|nr:hypothetical protein [Clostridiaceae bacterium]MDD6273648.1 hypothetical protein [Clostridiaceae bacterium]
MKKFFDCIRQINPLSALILRYGTRISLMMLAIAILFTYLQKHIRQINTILTACAKVYPLLTLMVFAITVTGALLIDVYVKRQDRK